MRAPTAAGCAANTAPATAASVPAAAGRSLGSWLSVRPENRDPCAAAIASNATPSASAQLAARVLRTSDMMHRLLLVRGRGAGQAAGVPQETVTTCFITHNSLIAGNTRSRMQQRRFVIDDGSGDHQDTNRGSNNGVSAACERKKTRTQSCPDADTALHLALTAQRHGAT